MPNGRCLLEQAVDDHDRPKVVSQGPIDVAHGSMVKPPSPPPQHQRVPLDHLAQTVADRLERVIARGPSEGSRSARHFWTCYSAGQP